MQKHDTSKEMDGVKEKLSAAFIRLTNDRKALIEALKKLDTNCAYCKHNQKTKPCTGANTDLNCFRCELECRCNKCTDNSNWEWIGEVASNG